MKSRSSRSAPVAEKKPISTKEVVFIRHGHSLGQAAHREQRRKDEKLRDADLSPIGLKQVHRLGKLVRAAKERNQLDPELVLTSPLTRALKTALTAFRDDKVLAHPGFAELNDRRPIPENRGRTLEELLCDGDMLEMGLEDRVDLSHVQALAWPSGSTIDGMEFLRERPEERVVIFSHHNYIQRQLEHSLHYVPNCEPIHVIVDFYETSHRVRLSDAQHRWWNLSSSTRFGEEVD